MKRSRWILIIFGAILLTGSSWLRAWAAPSPPGTADRPPLPPAESGERLPATPGTLQVQGLKAVLLVGPIDGPEGPVTALEKANMDLAAAELEINGVAVFKFYAPDADWKQIREVAEGAHFFLYRGHGVFWTEMPTPRVGGLALDGGIVSPDQIREELKLAPNAIVMLYGCFTAGSSSLDTESISSQEAHRRVAEYSDPFFDTGAAGYYADWFGDAFQLFVRYLFQGMTLGQAYEAFYDFGEATVERFAHPEHPELVLWLDKDNWSERWQYDNAFAGLADWTLDDLFQVPTLDVSPQEITYLAGPGSPPREFALTINGAGLGPVHWVVKETPNVPWLDLDPPVGDSPVQVMSVVIAPAGQRLGAHRANIEITPDDAGLEDQSQVIPVTLHRLAEVHRVFLPVVFDATP